MDVVTQPVAGYLPTGERKPSTTTEPGRPTAPQHQIPRTAAGAVRNRIVRARGVTAIALITTVVITAIALINDTQRPLITATARSAVAVEQEVILQLQVRVEAMAEAEAEINRPS